MFRIRVTALVLAVALVLGALGFRIVAMIRALRFGDPSPLLSLPFTAILPAVLLVLLGFMPAARTQEGLLMRVGAMIQLILIVALPAVALYLSLGFPVVFLMVELFETRVPRRVREPLARFVIA